MIPQMTVVADLTCSEEQLNWKPGYAVGDCHTCRLPGVHGTYISMFAGSGPRAALCMPQECPPSWCDGAVVFVFLAQTKMSWRSPLTSQYLR